VRTPVLNYRKHRNIVFLARAVNRALHPIVALVIGQESTTQAELQIGDFVLLVRKQMLSPESVTFQTKHSLIVARFDMCGKVHKGYCQSC